MTFRDVGGDSVLERAERLRRRWALGEERLVEISGRETVSPSNNHEVALGVPLQYGARGKAKPTPNLCRNGNLALGSDPRLCDPHVSHYHGNDPVATGYGPRFQRARVRPDS